MHKPRIVLAHDWLVGMRGGEWVLDRLARLYGPTDLYTLVSNGSQHTDAIEQCHIHTSPLQRFPGGPGLLRRHYLPIMPWAVGQLKVDSCDLLISTSSAVMKSITPPPGTPHLCYCHTPARYIWEQGNEYGIGKGGFLRSIGLRAVKKRFQDWDKRTAKRVTKFLANSKHTAARIMRCYGRESDVVYPPVRTECFTPDQNVAREDWYLVVSALEPYKRTDVVVKAANKKGFSLKIAGDGSQRKSLEQIAGPSVEFLGRASHDELLSLYRRAKALIFPQLEDFGIIAAEAQAAGCPVVAYAKGGAIEIITEDTGEFFVEQTPTEIIEAIRRLELKQVDPTLCHTNAARFSEERFDQEIVRQVDHLISKDA